MNWISVDKKLPKPPKKKNQFVKCFCWSKSGPFIAYYSPSAKVFLNYSWPQFSEIKDVTHWAEIKPPTN